ncbi:hypothetical protein Oweho_2299 [Owenweeksia hongkongensis DSM 17368]|uniref:DUF1735 domain-containing protein n=1 Tax=Owenweeksia hongkongensis (strain DSM 17368 / CIP 108786 / JCM 12287 / NRRL B-23963 / UST20020801) TaxID=926562 RepID=G8R5J7_OWEHD|nr:hypothetical protein [Owenweeksia hongkongensis]AEV33271.1 hypothetical protein Oweho_2299 [Owenweeksia hongkongensis DSM 17368]
MKKLLLLTAIVFISTVACKKIDELTQFEMEYNESVVIPSSSGLNLPFNLFTPEVESNSESAFAVNDTRKDLIEEIQLIELELTVSSPSNSDFSFLKSIDVYISAEGLSERRIAWGDNIPENKSSIQLETTDADLQEFIKKDEFKLRLNTITDEAMSSDHTIDVHSVFFVDAEILGQ